MAILIFISYYQQEITQLHNDQRVRKCGRDIYELWKIEIYKIIRTTSLCDINSTKPSRWLTRFSSCYPYDLDMHPISSRQYTSMAIIHLVDEICQKPSDPDDVWCQPKPSGWVISWWYLSAWLMTNVTRTAYYATLCHSDDITKSETSGSLRCYRNIIQKPYGYCAMWSGWHAIPPNRQYRKRYHPNELQQMHYVTRMTYAPTLKSPGWESKYFNFSNSGTVLP